MIERYSYDFPYTNYQYSISVGEDGKVYRTFWRISYNPLKVVYLFSIVKGHKSISFFWK